MNGVVYLKKSGIYTRSGGKVKKLEFPISYYLHHTPKIEKGFSVFDLMQILKFYETDIDQLFMAYTRGFKLHPFFEEINNAEQKLKEKPINVIEFSWQISVDNFKEFGKPLYEISEYIHLTGKKELEKVGYSLSFISLNNLKNAVFKLNERIEYSRIDFGELWEEKKYDKKVFLKGKKIFSLENIIGAFLNEITYFGYPSERNFESEKLDEISENINESECISHEELMLGWKEKFLSELLKKKESKSNALKVEKLKKEIAFLQNKLIVINAEKKV